MTQIQAPDEINETRVKILQSRGRFIRIVGLDARFTHVFASALYYFFLICRIVALSGSAIVPVLALYEAQRLVTAFTGAAVFLAEVAIRTIKPGEHAIAQNLKADALLLEHRRYVAAVPPYKDPATRFDTFHENVSAIRRQNQVSERKILAQTFNTDSPTTEEPELKTRTPRNSNKARPRQVRKWFTIRQQHAARRRRD
ncbi:hypothetical protein [Amycolatopsis sp. NPDC051371]|uniref:hypothetical protein n=1 Tax=Amycolatopsis sp. NPDC051371 TaxID=3155800 RepID=UPI003417EE5E